MTKTKIIATLGPASDTEEMMLSLIRAGADIFRLNMSHASREWHRGMISRARALTKRHGVEPVCVLGDLSGPKVRVGRLRGGELELVKGGTVVLTSWDVEGGAGLIPVTYAGLGKDMPRGGRVLIADGMQELKVLHAAPGELSCRVVKGGVLKERKGVNFPGLPLRLPSLTKKDLLDLELLLEEGADYVALSFVRAPSDVSALKRRIKNAGRDTPVIAKIERPEAVREIRGIIAASDGIMVARGDLGVEMPPEQVPLIQKRIIRLCHEMDRPVITATQMLESMVVNPRPTRAEASDVAGAVFDGTDALMLSEETASGAYPAGAAAMMNRVARAAERLSREEHMHGGKTGAEAVADAACRTALEVGARAIICFTRTGATALIISKRRPAAKVVAATSDMRALRRMRLYYGVSPVKVGWKGSTDSMIREVERAALSRGLVKEGDLVVLTLGVPIKKDAETNLMKLHRVGQGFGK